VQAHGYFGTELSDAFNLRRTMFSVTTDPATASKFGSTVFRGTVPVNQLFKQTIPGAGESEYLLPHGSNSFYLIK
jgi:filamentous hemagglutinin